MVHLFEMPAADATPSHDLFENKPVLVLCCCRVSQDGVMHALVSWMEYQLFPDGDQWMVSVNSESMKCHQCACQQ